VGTAVDVPACAPVDARLAVARTAWLPIGCAAALFSVAYVTRAVWPQLLGCALLGLVGASLLAVWRPLRLQVRIDLPDRVVVGKPFETAVVVRNLSGRPARAFVVRHRWLTGRRLVAPHAAFVDGLKARGEIVVRTTRTPVARGVLAASEVRIDATAPFGFFSRYVVVPVSRELLVLPLLATASAPRVAGGEGGGASIRTIGADAGGVRDWRPGDQARHVQWRSTARTGRLSVLEREQVSGGALVVLIVGRNGEATFEAAISRAASACSLALRRRTTVLIARADGGCVRARTEGALLELLARADVPEPLSEAALQRALRGAANGGQVLLANGPSVPAEWRLAVRRAAAAAGARVMDE
jgi:uncharacterized protein (DUF58 family)